MFDTAGYATLFAASFLAATVVPFSSEALLSAMLCMGFDPVVTLTVATLGNWLGGMSSYAIGRLGKIETIEKWLRIKPERIERFAGKVTRYGHWLALLAWAPAVGDVIAVSLGLFKASAVKTTWLMLLGKAGRYAGLGDLTLAIAENISQ